MKLERFSVPEGEQSPERIAVKTPGVPGARPCSVVVALLGLLSFGCSPFRISLEWGHAPIAYPRQSTVDSLVCTPTKDPLQAVRNAWGYLSKGAFAWMDESRSVAYLQRAIDRRMAGECPCPESGCAALPPVEPPGGAL